uniref:RNA polymerase sigma-70 domain-containing protein n=1 Tax=Rhodosorus marinus TaxID=101924 RepID=A0A7S0G4L1_9RHOD|mmetsp:Transcript_21260/g.30897  ORF Transcript_21260/g.30897 Transcript_21260/m.30897 type:complete len:447 (+) Transcript_21260:244-1584(+)|eukprot:CAMPEP_0184738890 /NCGR_PEP_ID=MMETSP0315-20130426/1639_1 /TAXON_ID=101924 /ORGANISM="Rhodosorus marinus, Strain UTEX LB 2760" /LENGTH=446 /DNA_ID=CAMNT_0027207087 /DNA_START=183 /DNA_END=1523 /DNA_ORIENTATION=+
MAEGRVFAGFVAGGAGGVELIKGRKPAACVVKEADVKVGKRPRSRSRSRKTGRTKKPSVEKFDYSRLDSVEGWVSEVSEVAEVERLDLEVEGLDLEVEEVKRDIKVSRNAFRKSREKPLYFKRSLVHYTSDVRRVDLLTRSEEVDLARRIQKCTKLQTCKEKLRATFGRNPTFKEWAENVEMDVERLKEIIIAGNSAKQALVSANLRLIQSIVNKSTRPYGMIDDSLKQDLMQEGVFGLMRAADKYDTGKGFRFSTYATYWVRSLTSRALQRIERPVRVPTRIYEHYTRMKNVHTEYLNAHGRRPTEYELARLVGMTDGKMQMIVESVNQSFVSTDLALTGGPEGMTVGDVLQGEVDLDEELVESMFKIDCDKALRKYLDPRERAAIRLRYGLDDGGERTMKQISRALNVSPGRTRQIINGSISKLRNRAVFRDLREYMTGVIGLD